MQTIIRDNNQYLKNVTGIPIYGLPSAALDIEITIRENDTSTTQIRTKVRDYILNAEWCHGLEPTDSEGKYFIITFTQQLSEAREWLDDNLEGLFVNYIPQFGSFTPSDGYAFPKRGDKPKYSGQLGTYADKLRTLYPNTPQTEHHSVTKWNKSPLHKTRTNSPPTLVFSPEEYPILPRPSKKRTQQDQLPPQSTSSVSNTTATTSVTAQELRNQIIQDIKDDFTKLISNELTNLREELKETFSALKTNIQQDTKNQIDEVLKTIQVLNQRFSEVMDRLPPKPTPAPAHKKSKGLGASD